MTTEAVTETTETKAPPPVKNGKVKKDVEVKAETKTESEDVESLVSAAEADPEPRGSAALTPELKQIRAAEDASLRDMLAAIGPDGSFKIQVRRTEPTEWVDPTTGRRVKVDGLLKSYEQSIDEEFIQKQHGGGRIVLKVFKKNPKGGYTFGTQRTIDIAGDPRTDDVPRNQPTAPAAGAAAQPAHESESLVTKAFSILTDEVKSARERADAPRTVVAPSTSPELMAMLTMLQEQLKTRDAQIASMQAEFRAMSNQKEPDSDFKTTMLTKFMDSDNSRVQSVRLAYEAEIRALKEGWHQEEERIRERVERDKTMMHDSHMREISNLKQSHEVTLAAINAANAAGTKSLEGEIRKLERDNSELRAEVKDLRAKKEKTLVEQIKDVDTIKELLGSGDEDGEKSTVQSIIEAIPAVPAAIAAARGMVPGAQQPQPQVQRQAPKRVIMTDANGQKFTAVNGKLVPVRPKQEAQAQAQAPSGPRPLSPENAAQLPIVVGYLERALSNNTDPETLAQSYKTMVPNEILVGIAEMGIEEFLIKVGNVPMSSPLFASLASKNWLRKVQKALVGGE